MNKQIKHFFLVITFVFFKSIAFSQTNYFPEKNWESKSASSLGLKQSSLDSFISFAVRNENKIEKDVRIAMLKSYEREPSYKIIGPTKHRGPAAGMIIKSGYVAAKWGDIDRVDMSFSITKSFLSSMAGLAIDKGLVSNVNETVDKYVWDGTFDGPHNSKVTWKHLLQQTSDWSGCQFGICDWADRPPKTGSIDDWKNRKLLEPGSTFEYNDVRVNLLSYALLNVWRKPMPMVLKENIMDVIGCSTTWRWHGYDDAFVNVDGQMMQSVSGGGHHGGGLFINTSDMARYGYLFLRNGQWKNKTIISKSWIDEAITPSNVQKDYGYLWWNNSLKEWPDAPASLYYAVGYGGNYIIIDKENDLVIVLRWMDNDKMNELLKKIYK